MFVFLFFFQKLYKKKIAEKLLEKMLLLSPINDFLWDDYFIPNDFSLNYILKILLFIVLLIR